MLNEVDVQIDAAITIYCLQISSTCFELFLAHPQERSILHTEHMVLNASLRASDRQISGDIIPHTVNHSLALLRMGKKLHETC